MIYNDEFYEFIEKNENEDSIKLLLKKKTSYSFDYTFAIEQIASRQKIKSKLPTWFENKRLLFPNKITAEQASSELTAKYKQKLITGDYICDLTGGLGVDTYYFSQKASQVIYIERFRDYCEMAKHNFSCLGKHNIRIENTDCITFLESTDIHFGTLYIDPARRGSENSRLYAIKNCEPNVLEMLPLMFRKSVRIIIKVSPMADITQSLSELPHVSEVHIVSVKNECKELLFVLDRDYTGSPTLLCTDLNVRNENAPVFSFHMQEESEAVCNYSGDLKRYLYEPNASILKAGAFKTLSLRYKIDKLHVSSHLYTSDNLISNFPGRVFEIEKQYQFTNKVLNELAKEHKDANITIRNFPLKVDEIRKKTKIRDGGFKYLFFTTLHPDIKIIISGRKVD